MGRSTDFQSVRVKSGYGRTDWKSVLRVRGFQESMRHP
jgi:hypothetical protein